MPENLRAGRSASRTKRVRAVASSLEVGLHKVVVGYSTPPNFCVFVQGKLLPLLLPILTYINPEIPQYVSPTLWEWCQDDEKFDLS